MVKKFTCKTDQWVTEIFISLLTTKETFQDLLRPNVSSINLLSLWLTKKERMSTALEITIFIRLLTAIASKLSILIVKWTDKTKD